MSALSPELRHIRSGLESAARWSEFARNLIVSIDDRGRLSGPQIDAARRVIEADNRTDGVARGKKGRLSPSQVKAVQQQELRRQNAPIKSFVLVGRDPFTGEEAEVTIYVPKGKGDDYFAGYVDALQKIGKPCGVKPGSVIRYKTN